MSAEEKSPEAAPPPALKMGKSSEELAQNLQSQWAWAKDAYQAFDQSNHLAEKVTATRTHCQVCTPLYCARSADLHCSTRAMLRGVQLSAAPNPPTRAKTAITKN